MTAYGGVEVQLNSFSVSALHGVTGQFYALAAIHPGNSSGIH